VLSLLPWGGLKKIDNKLYTCYGNEYKDGMATFYEDGFRGYNYFDSYTQEQIQTLEELLIYWNQRYGIPLTYNADMFDVSKRALQNVPGIWSHTSFRADKSDIAPQNDMVQMLKSLD
jgi:hypothetical protein